MAQVGGGGHRFEGGCRYAKERFGGRDEDEGLAGGVTGLEGAGESLDGVVTGLGEESESLDGVVTNF